MKLFFRLMIFVILLVFASLFFIKGSDNKPILSLDSFRKANISMPSSESVEDIKQDLAEKIKKAADTLPIDKDKTVTIYKWKDSKGNWTYSDHPNTGGGYDKVVIKPYGNVLHFEEPRDDISTQPLMDTSEDQDRSLNIPLPTSIPPGDIPELIEDAKGVQKILDADARQKEQAVHQSP